MIRGEMWRRVLVLCCVLSGLCSARGDTVEPDSRIPLSGAAGEREQDAPSGAKAEQSARGGERLSPGTTQETTAEPLEEELNNQENVLSQLLGDYDKVKIVSSGSNCVCRCVVRPIKRSECSRVSDTSPTQPPQDFYTLETVTTGTDCKQCMCLAPPSAVNPCEGEYRLKKLQEATKDDIKLATIIDLLQGSLYGMDLLKLNSVTNKLLARVDNMEKTFSRSFTDRVKEHAKERVKEKEKEKKAQVKKKKVNDSERKNGAAAVNNKQKNLEERSTGSQRKKNQTQDSVEQKQPTRKKTASQKPVKDQTEPKQPIKDKNSLVVKGVTFYKADGGPNKEEEQQRVLGANTILTDASEDVLVSDQLPSTGTLHIRSPGLSTAATTKPTTRGANTRKTGWTQTPSAPTRQTSALTTTTKADPTTTHPTNKPTTNLPPTTTSITTTNKLTTTPHQTITTATTTTQPTTFTTQYSTSFPHTNVAPPFVESPTATASHPGPKSRLSWTESPADQLKTTKKPAVCKDTVASISEPVQQNSYGNSDGAWMRDARGHGNVIYLTNGDYGNNLLEFRDMDTFISGQISNSYKLPYSFTGTGHVVFNGAFFYNRAFSRDIIRYDLRHRYVTAWTTLHNAVLEEQAQRTRTEVEFAVDESGLWLLYPALDTEGFHQEVILLTQLRPRDLLPINSFRTGLRRGLYGNAFLVCGVLYGVNSMDRHYANVTYAFDTHTLTHTVPSLAFTNTHAHTSQLAYCPLDKKLYAWDNGHQMMYDVIFAY